MLMCRTNKLCVWERKAVNECFYSYFELLEAFMNVSVTQPKREENAFNVF